MSSIITVFVYCCYACLCALLVSHLRWLHLSMSFFFFVLLAFFSAPHFLLDVHFRLLLIQGWWNIVEHTFVWTCLSILMMSVPVLIAMSDVGLLPKANNPWGCLCLQCFYAIFCKDNDWSMGMTIILLMRLGLLIKNRSWMAYPLVGFWFAWCSLWLYPGTGGLQSMGTCFRARCVS